MMRKLKLLFITKELSNYIYKNQHYLSLQLRNQCDLIQWDTSGTLQDILSKIHFAPDFILLNDLRHCPKISGLANVQIPKGVIMMDIHRMIPIRKQFVIENRIDYIFSVTREMFLKTYPEFKKKFRWLPHFVSTDIYKDYGERKSINWLMMGVMNKKIYPLRSQIKNSLQNHSSFIYHPHPGYYYFKPSENRVLTGESYAKEINRAKIFLTCDSIYHYPLLKYYEVLACRTLLLAPPSRELKALGFIPGKHFVPINGSNYYRKAVYYLKNEKKRIRITERGYKMVRLLHSSKVRASQLVKMIKQIILIRKRGVTK